jgi:hypothetical protein
MTLARPSVVKNSNANCPNRPSQNEFRKSVPVRLHPLSCDFSATSLISVIAKLRAPSRRDTSAFGVTAFGRKPPFEFPAQFAAPCRDVPRRDAGATSLAHSLNLCFIPARTARSVE